MSTDGILDARKEEFEKIKNILGRTPNFTEMSIFSVMWSEHCSYKSSRIHLDGLITDGPNIILGPKEDAGIVSVATDNKGKRYGIVISHESHNHPVSYTHLTLPTKRIV